MQYPTLSIDGVRPRKRVVRTCYTRCVFVRRPLLRKIATFSLKDSAKTLYVCPPRATGRHETRRMYELFRKRTNLRRVLLLQIRKTGLAHYVYRKCSAGAAAGTIAKNIKYLFAHHM